MANVNVTRWTGYLRSGEAQYKVVSRAGDTMATVKKAAKEVKAALVRISRLSPVGLLRMDAQDEYGVVGTPGGLYVEGRVDFAAEQDPGLSALKRIVGA